MPALTATPRSSSCPRPLPACTTRDHETLKSDDALWRLETRPEGIQYNRRGTPILEIATCLACGSTLGRKR